MHTRLLLRRRLRAATVVAAALLCGAARALAGGGPADVVVLVNDASEDSVAVAEHYAAARQVPASNLCHVRCATDSTVPVADFVRDVVEPLRTFLRTGDLDAHVRYLVLTQGMPIRTRTGDNFVSTAALLSLLDSPIAGEDVSRLPRHAAPYRNGVAPREPLPGLGRVRLVTALLSSARDEAIALIDRSVASDGTAPKDTLVLFQDANGNANVRNGAYDAAARQLESLGHRTEHLKAGAKEATDRQRVMAYMSGGAYSALSVEGVGTNEYLPGAICDMLQSFGAVPQNFVPGDKGSQFPITHLVRAGITGIHGCVAEPYTLAFPPADLFTPYFQGFTLAETFHQKIPTAYWMNLVLGDPLCAPYAERPAPVVQIGGKAPASDALRGGSAELELSDASGTARRYEVYLGPWFLGALDGPGGKLPVKTPELPAGPVDLVVQAIGPGFAEPTGWTTVRLEGPTARGRPQAEAPPAAADLVVEAPRSVVAGEDLDVRYTLVDAGGAPVSGGEAYAELRGTTPPVRWAAGAAPAGADGRRGGLTVKPTRAGPLLLELRLPDLGISRPVSVVVTPAAARVATTPLSRVTERQCTDIPVVVQDAFGNQVDGFKGTVTLAAPGVPSFVAPEAVRLDGAGRGVFRDVVFPAPGGAGLVFRVDGATWSQPGEGVQAAPTAIRAWLLGSPYGAKESPDTKSDPGADATADGRTSDGRLFRRVREQDDEIPFAQGVGEGRPAVAVAHVIADRDVVATLLLAARDDVRVLLDGAEVFHGVPASSDMRAPGDSGKLKLAKGPHRVTVIAQRKGRPGFALALAEGKSALAPGLSVVAAAPSDDASRRTVSGRVHRFGRAAGGVRVTLVAGGAERSTTTDATGAYWFDGAPDGELHVSASGAEFVPAGLTVDAGATVVTDLDFGVADGGPPKVALTGLGRTPHFGSRVLVTPEVSDDGGLRRVTLFVGGVEVASSERAPWTLEWRRGARAGDWKTTLAVAAVDQAGNETRSDDMAVEFVTDTTPPVISLRGLSKKQTVRKEVTVTVSARDDVADPALLVSLDGAALTAEDDGKGGKRVRLDPKVIGAGAHELRVRATDDDGNEAVLEIPFKVP